MSEVHTDPLIAADPHRSAWVSANAGAGKTRALANRVARLLLDGAAPERILCLTYTKAAAAEMQTRLFAQLGAWAMYDDAKLRLAIAAIGAPLPDAEGLNRARRLFALALETPGGLKIQTIHSFCQYLLARFPLEANIPPSFRVLDDQTSRDLVAEARASVLERAGAGEKPLADATAYLVTETSESRLHQILAAALGNDRGKLERFFSSLAKTEHALAIAAARTHGAVHGETGAQIAEQFCTEARSEAERLTAVIAWLSGGGKSDGALAAKLRAFLACDFAPQAFSGLRAAFCNTDGNPKDKLATKALCSGAPTLLECLTSFAHRYIEAEQRYRAARTAQLSHAALTLAAAVQQEYAALKRARSALDYGDLISETLKLLDKSEAAAWVLYKLDGGIHHVLIDEAQDTSPEQWEIVRRLTEEFFSGRGSDDLFGGTRTIFAVGDEKQSIFSFQGADPDAFAKNREYFAAHAGKAFADVRLAESHRSAPEILTFVDTLFAPAAAREGLTSGNSAIEHRSSREGAGGRVEFWPALKPPKAPEPDWWRPIDVESDASPVVQLAERIAAQIRRWLDNKVRLPGHDEPIRPGDIMILMPRREPFASEMIRILIQRDVAVAGADRIRLKNEIAIMDVISLGRFALLPEDDLNLAALLRSPLIDISEGDLLSLAFPRKGRLWNELSARRDELPAFAAAHEFLSDTLAHADFSPPYEFFARALTSKGGRARLLARLGAEASDAIDEFLSLALEYESVNAPSLEGFLHWIERGDAEIKRDMERGRNEVRIMTVHGAKGLESDIVILPDTTTLPDPPGRRGELLYREDGIVFPIRNVDACAAVLAAKEAAKREALKEHRRLLYVALTRAKERLYICGFENKNGIRDQSWYRLAEAAAGALGEKIARGDRHIHAVGDICEEETVIRSESPPAARELPAWARTPPQPEGAALRLIHPSSETDSEPATISPAGPRGLARFQRGLIIHTLLARLPDINPNDRAHTSKAFLAGQGLSPEDSLDITSKVLRIFEDAEFAPAFAPASKAETAVVADLPALGKGVRVSGRIDRLAVTEEEILAIDFKTNRPPPTRIEDVSPAYLRQMGLYRLALAKIFPGRRIACALVWTEGPHLMRVPDDLMEREIAGFRASLDLG